MALPRTSNGTVVRVNRIDRDLISLEVQVDRKLPRFKPGQFAHLAQEEYKPENRWPKSRVFSVANYSDGSNLVFLISRQGPFTSSIIDNVKTGTRVAVKGPYGNFHITHTSRNIVLICGGSGISAFSALFEALIIEKSNVLKNFLVLYGAREQHLLQYQAEMDELKRLYPGFKAHLFVENISSNMDGYIHGRPDLNVLNKSIFEETAQFYISGGRGMIDHYKSLLIKHYNVPENDIIIDAWE